MKLSDSKLNCFQELDFNQRMGDRSIARHKGHTGVVTLLMVVVGQVILPKLFAFFMLRVLEYDIIKFELIPSLTYR